MNIELIPVLEIPVMAQRRLPEIQRPPSTFQQHPIEWDEYQRQLLVTGGFSDYQRVIKGGNFVRADQWSLPDLRLLARNHLAGDKEIISIEASCALFGGCILVVNNIPVLVPQCCSTIADFTSWQGLLSPQFISGYFCIEGHPCPEAVKTDTHILITCEDSDESFDQPARPKIVLEIAALVYATEQAKQIMDALSDRIDLLSAELGVAKAADYLVWAKP